MQECRKANGLSDPARLIDLPMSLREPLAISTQPTAGSLRAAIRRLSQILDALSDEDRALGYLTWNITPSSDRTALGPLTTAIRPLIGLEWLERCRNAADSPSLPWNDERNIRRKSDRIVLNTVISLTEASDPPERIFDSGLRTSPHQDAAMPALLEAVEQCRNVQVELLEYAGLTTLPLIRSLRLVGAHIRLLVKHPDTVVGLQRDRGLTTLDTLYTSLFLDYESSFECRCYRAPYSLRARQFGSHLLELGWLTPDIQRDTTFGYNNPSLLLDPTDPRFSHFVKFFGKTFSDLWEDQTTEDGLSVLGRPSKRAGRKKPPSPQS